MKGMFNVIESKAETVLNHDFVHWDLVNKLENTIKQYHSDLVEAEDPEEVE